MEKYIIRKFSEGLRFAYQYRRCRTFDSDTEDERGISLHASARHKVRKNNFLFERDGKTFWQLTSR